MAVSREILLVNGLLMLSEAQMRRIKPYFPRSHGVPRVDDRRILSGIIFVIRNGLRWRDAPVGYGPHKTIYNRFIRWRRLGVFNKIFSSLAAASDTDDCLMIDATHLKAHRTATSLLKKHVLSSSKGVYSPIYWEDEGRVKLEAPRCVRRDWQAFDFVPFRRPDERPYRRKAHISRAPKACHLHDRR